MDTTMFSSSNMNTILSKLRSLQSEIKTLKEKYEDLLSKYLEQSVKCDDLSKVIVSLTLMVINQDNKQSQENQQSQEKVQEEEEQQQPMSNSSRQISPITLKEWSIIENTNTQIVTCILPLSTGSIATGTLNGTICINKIDYQSKKIELSIKKNFCHYEKIVGLIELANKQIISGALDKFVKVWEITSDNLEEIYSFKPHNNKLLSILPLSESVIWGSCTEEEIKIWTIEYPFTEIQNLKEQLKVNTLYQPKNHRELLIVFHVIGLYFYNLETSSKKENMFGVTTQRPNGICELGKQRLLISNVMGGCVSLVNIEEFFIERSFKYNTMFQPYIPSFGALGDDMFIWAGTGNYYLFSFENKDIRLICKKTINAKNFVGSDLVMLKDGFMIISNNNGGITLYQKLEN